MMRKIFKKIASVCKILIYKLTKLSLSCHVQLSLAPQADIQLVRGNRLRFGALSKLIMHQRSQIICSGSFVFGDNCTVILHEGSKLYLGDHSWCLHGCWIEVGKGQALTLGDRVTLQLRCSLHGEIYIGNDCLFAPDIYISSGSHSFDGNLAHTIRTQDSKYPITSKPVLISSNCWLGIRTFVAPGVRLGEGTVTGANSVLLSDTDQFSVYAGVPAKKIRSYLTDSIQN